MVSNIVTSVGGLIYSKATSRYLFLLRDNTSYSNTWGLCGGKIESGETLTDALCREIREEIGEIDIKKITPLEKFTSDNQKFIYHTVLITVDNEFVPTLNSEHKGYCWVRLEDHPSPLHPGVWKTFSFDSVIEKIKTFEFIAS